jgi:hypothetical protein
MLMERSIAAARQIADQSGLSEAWKAKAKAAQKEKKLTHVQTSAAEQSAEFGAIEDRWDEGTKFSQRGQTGTVCRS